jgi:hypothetical protein
VNRRSSLLAGAVSGLLAGLLFATLHAFIIVPIWNRMMMGLAFGTVAGIAAGWAYAELEPQAASQRRGLTFGLLLFVAVVPVTIVDATLRSIGFTQQHRDLADAISVALAVAGGATIAWLRAKRVRPSVAMGVAALSLTLAMGGPVPAMRNARAAEIYLAVAAAALFGGVMLAFLEPRVRQLSASIFGAGRQE